MGQNRHCIFFESPWEEDTARGVDPNYIQVDSSKCFDGITVEQRPHGEARESSESECLGRSPEFMSAEYGLD